MEQVAIDEPDPEAERRAEGRQLSKRKERAERPEPERRRHTAHRPTVSVLAV